MTDTNKNNNIPNETRDEDHEKKNLLGARVTFQSYNGNNNNDNTRTRNVLGAGVTPPSMTLALESEALESAAGAAVPSVTIAMGAGVVVGDVTSEEKVDDPSPTMKKKKEKKSEEAHKKEAGGGERGRGR